MTLAGLLVAAIASICIAAGRLLQRIRDDAAGSVFLGLGGFFVALSAYLVGSRIFWVAPLSIVAGMSIGRYYIHKRGLR